MVSKNYITVLEGQNLNDLGILFYGSPEGADVFILDNPGLCDMEHDPQPGTKLSYDPAKVINKDVVRLLAEKGISPANSSGEIQSQEFSSAFAIAFK